MVGLMLRAMRVDRLLSDHGIGQDSAAGRQEFERQMERRRLEALDEEALKPLRRGWCLGREQFKEQMLMEGKLDENMRQVLIHPGEDGYWVAECPSLPGCVSRGATREESVRDNPLAQTVVPAHRELDRGTLRCFTPICSQAAKVLVDELPREAFGVRPACWRCREAWGGSKAGASSTLKTLRAVRWRLCRALQSVASA
jgi:hypothetical protein